MSSLSSTDPVDPTAMLAEPTFDTKTVSLPRSTGPQAVAQFADIIAPDETRYVRAPVRRAGRPDVGRSLVASVREGSSVSRYGVGDLLVCTPLGMTAAYLGAISLGLLSAIRSPLFEAEQPGSTYEPLPDNTILGGFRRTLETRRVSIGDRYYHALHRQLVALLADEDELAEASVRPSLVSFVGLLEFLRRNDGVRHPGLSLDRQGRFVAAWQPCGRAKLSITFDGIAAAKWTAANRAGQSSERGSGALTMMSANAVDARFRDWLFP